jgi:hypothetical protein
MAMALLGERHDSTQTQDSTQDRFWDSFLMAKAKKAGVPFK